MKLVIKYYRRCPEWHERSSPYIVDEDTNRVVCRMECFVMHPGIYDEVACKYAEAIVNCVNGTVALINGIKEL